VEVENDLMPLTKPVAVNTLLLLPRSEWHIHTLHKIVCVCVCGWDNKPVQSVRQCRQCVWGQMSGCPSSCVAECTTTVPYTDCNITSHIFTTNDNWQIYTYHQGVYVLNNANNLYHFITRNCTEQLHHLTTQPSLFRASAIGTKIFKL